MSARGKLRIGYLSTLYHSSLLIKGSKSLEKAGIEPEWHLFGTGPAIIDSFTKGNLDVGYIGLSPTAIGIGKGAKVKCIAGGHVEGTVIAGKKGLKTVGEMSGSLTKTLSQLRGKRIGVPRGGSLHDVFLRFYLSRAGITDAKIINYDWADFIPNAMSSGEIDAACGTPPLAVLLSRLVGARIIVPPKMIWPNNPSYGIVASKEMLADSRELLAKFLELHKQVCCVDLHEHKEASAKVVAKEVGLVDKKFILDTYNVSPKYCATLSDEFVDSTMRLLPVLKELGYLSGELPRDEIFEFGLIRDLHPEKAHYAA